MLSARYKGFEREPNGMMSGAAVCCGFPRCGEAIAAVVFGGSTCVLGVPAGYVERSPGLWVLGNHAARSHRKVPRRPRQSFLPTGMARIERGPGGALEAHYLGRVEQMKGAVRDADHGLADQRGQFILLVGAKQVTIACSRHGHRSVIRRADIESEFRRRFPQGSADN
jgi:hypothetical protein